MEKILPVSRKEFREDIAAITRAIAAAHKSD